MNLKEDYLNLLVLKSYLVDNNNSLTLDNGYNLRIDVEEKKINDDYVIRFKVLIIGDKSYKINYDYSLKISLKELLEKDIQDKIDFISEWKKYRVNGVDDYFEDLQDNINFIDLKASKIPVNLSTAVLYAALESTKDLSNHMTK